jgi:membrane fusion protein (multidrug efflux system)
MSEREYLHFADRVNSAMQAEKRSQQHGPPIELILADGSVYPEPGEFALPDREVDLKTGTITVVSYFPNPKGILRPGLYAKVRAVTDQKVGALLVPQRAVQELQGTRRVAVVNAEKKVEFRMVKASTRVGTLWVIDEGLTPTDQVVVEGLQKVREGVPVIAKPAPTELTSATMPTALTATASPPVPPTPVAKSGEK